MTRSRPPASRMRWRLATLLGVVAASALVFRGCLYRSDSWTIRVTNVGATPLEDVELAHREERRSFGTIPPGEARQVVLRAIPAGGVGLHYRAGEVSRSVPLMSTRLRPPFGSTRIVEEVRLDESGLQSARWTMRGGLFD